MWFIDGRWYWDFLGDGTVAVLQNYIDAVLSTLALLLLSIFFTFCTEHTVDVQA